jgi:aminoglycoside 6'-N-acetyltransferase I
MSSITIRPYQPTDYPEWLRMRLALWPDGSEADWQHEIADILADPHQPVFVAERPDGTLGGFLEVSLRKYADGCDSSPVGYLEGWYVDADLRRTGVGAALVQAAENWARAQGCTEMGSDTEIENRVSFRAHLALGYEEAERLIHFCKAL